MAAASPLPNLPAALPCRRALADRAVLERLESPEDLPCLETETLEWLDARISDTFEYRACYDALLAGSEFVSAVLAASRAPTGHAVLARRTLRASLAAVSALARL